MNELQEINKLKVNQNAEHNFADAIEILLNKPHVVNKRLCGKNILYRERYPGVKTLSNEQMVHLIERIKYDWKLFDTKLVENFVKQIFSQLEGEPEPDAKKQKVTDEKCAGMSCFFFLFFFFFFNCILLQ